MNSVHKVGAKMHGTGRSASPADESQPLVIRSAVRADVRLLTELIHEFAKFEGLPAVITEADLRRDGFGPQPKFRVLIAEWQKQPAGYALFFDYYSTFRGRSGIFLEDIYVLERFRAQGVGKALFARLAAIVLREYRAGIMFNVLDWNNKAIDFYRRIGATFLDNWRTICLEGTALERLGAPDDPAGAEP